MFWFCPIGVLLNCRYLCPLQRAKVLGKGAFKTVYKAFDAYEALDVAWNKLPVGPYSEDDVRKIQEELDFLTRLYHKNIINTYASWLTEKNGVPETRNINFITELMVSGTLKDFINSSKSITLKVIRKWCANILEALEYLHKQNPTILHRDLRCENIFVNGNVGEVKLGDLGLSSLKEGEKTVTVIGAPEFMAPELHNQSYTEKVDIYAFGMCMLEMVTMESPYSECENPATILRKVFQEEKPMALLRMKDCDMKDVISMCLGPKEERPTTEQLLAHPLFKAWKDDPGVLTNVDLTKPVEKEGQSNDVMTSNVEMNFGTLLVRNVPSIDRDVVISRNTGVIHQIEDASKTFSPLPNERGEIRISVHIPLEGTMKKVEFMFDMAVDSASDISHEMKTEFHLDENRAQKVRNEIEAQVQAYRLGQVFDKRNTSLAGSTPNGSVPSTSPVPSMASLTSSVVATVSKPSSVATNPTTSASKKTNNGEDVSSPTTSPQPFELDTKMFALFMGLMEACKRGEIEFVRRNLSEGVSANFADYDLRTPLHLAVEEGHVDVALLLLENGANYHAKDRWGTTPITQAVVQGQAEIIDLLKQFDADVEAINLDQEQIQSSLELLECSKNGHVDSARQKLVAGGSVTHADETGRTALHFSSANGHVGVSELLLINGADALAKDKNGHTPVDDAANGGHVEVLRLFTSYEVPISADAFKKTSSDEDWRGMDINEQAHEGKVENIEELIAMGADVNYCDYDKRYPLHLASAEGHYKAVKVLLDAGADVTVRDRWGLTPSDEARRYKRRDVELLLEGDALVHKKPMNGSTTAANSQLSITEAADSEILHTSSSTNLTSISDLICIDDLKRQSMRRSDR